MKNCPCSYCRLHHEYHWERKPEDHQWSKWERDNNMIYPVQKRHCEECGYEQMEEIEIK